jgi:cytoskeleton protein RodZ
MMSTDQTSIEAEQADVNANETDSVNRENSPSPGARLAQQRQERGLSQKEVADKLHITIHYVNSIEHDAYEKLPGTVFARGYIRRYAELLNLEVEEYLQDFEQLQAQQQDGVQQLQAIQRRRASGRRNRSMAFASLILFVGVFVAVWYFSEGENGDTVAIANSEFTTEAMAETEPAPMATPGLSALPEPPANDQAPTLSASSADPQLDTDSQESTDSPESSRLVDQPVQTSGLIEQGSRGSPQTSVMDDEPGAQDPDDSGGQQAGTVVIPAPVAMLEQDVSPQPEEHVITVVADGDDVLRISFSGESWVEINDGSSNQIYRDLLEAGDILQITGTAPFNVLLGDAPFTELTFNGDQVDVTDNIRIDNSARLTVGL